MKSYKIILIILLALPCFLTQDAPDAEGEAPDAGAGEAATTDDEPVTERPPDAAENEVGTGDDSTPEPEDETPVTEEPSDGDDGDAKPEDKKKAGSFGSDIDVMEFRDVKKDSKAVCNALKTPQEDKMKVNLTGSLSYEDMLKLMTWTLKYDLKSGKKSLKMGPNIEWKREIIDLISGVFKKGCPTEYVPEAFINIAKELAMIYLNSVKTSKKKKGDWETTMKALRQCPDKMTKLRFSSRGFQAHSFVIKNKRGEEELLDLLPPMEMADSDLPFIDVIIDTMWWMFSYSFASCYPHMESKAIGLAQYKKLFYNDFLIDLIPRWKRGGRWTMAYGPIFGDMNIPQTLVNIRFCVTAAYTQNALADRQLVRPISLAALPGDLDTLPNKKTGEPYA